MSAIHVLPYYPREIGIKKTSTEQRLYEIQISQRSKFPQNVGDGKFQWILCGWGLEVYFSHVGGPFYLFNYHQQGCLNNTISLIWDYDLFNYHQQGWLNSTISLIWDYVLDVKHISFGITNFGQYQGVIPSLFLNSPIGFAARKYPERIYYPNLWIVFQHAVFPDCCICLYFVLSSWFILILVSSGWAFIDLRSAQVYCVAIFLVSQEVSLNFHRLCG